MEYKKERKNGLESLMAHSGGVRLLLVENI